MIVRRISDTEPIKTNDDSIVHEILKPKHTDFKIWNSLTYCLLKKGTKTTPHYIEHTEIYYIISGEGIIHTRKRDEPHDKEETVKVSKNTVVFISPNEVKYIENIGDLDLEIILIVNPYWRPEIVHNVK